MSRSLAVGLVACCSSLVTSAYAAGPPDPAHSSVPGFVRVVGTQNGTPDPTGTFKVTVRDAGNAPCPDVVVTLDFSQCSETRLALTQGPGSTLHPAHNSVTVQANSSGVATFIVVGGGLHSCTVPPAIGPGAGAGCARVCAAGVVLATVSANLYDLDALNGFDGVDGRDVEALTRDVGASGLGAAYRARVDYTQDGAVNSADFNLYAQLVWAHSYAGVGSASGSNGAGFCTGPFTPFPCP
jgi:hypothetical protein